LSGKAVVLELASWIAITLLTVLKTRDFNSKLVLVGMARVQLANPETDAKY